MEERKAALRSEIRTRLRQIDSEQRQAASARALGLLTAQKAWQSAKTVAFFAPLPDELDLWPWIRLALGQGKTAALPCFDSKTTGYVYREVKVLEEDLVPGMYGIREPGAHCPDLELNRLDLILVPGVGFDSQGHRLGRGKGFYDRLLAGLHAIKCGVAFDEQLVSHIPTEPHDEQLTCILTPTRWIWVNESGGVVA